MQGIFIDRHILDGITIAGLLLGVLGSLYLAYEFLDRKQEILHWITMYFTSAMMSIGGYIALWGSFFIYMLYLSPYTLVNLNENDLLRNGVIAGAVVGIFVSVSGFYFPDYSRIPGISRPIALVYATIAHILVIAWCWWLSNLDHATLPVSLGLSFAVFLILGGGSKTLKLGIDNLPEKRLGVIGILLILSGFVLALAQPVVDILDIPVH